MSAPRRSSAVLALLILGAGVLVTLAYFLLQRSRQPREGQVEVAGLEAPVEVTFDRWAIPRIAGGSERDVLFAQGFVHASERLWQLELFQRIARGRLAEVFGETALPTDRLMRTLDLWAAAGRELETLDASDRVSLEAYASGVNARVASWSGPWPPEFLILGIEPQPWSPRASLAIGRIMALDLSGWRNELTRTSVTSRLDQDRRAVLAPGYPAWGPTILQDEAAGGEAEGAVLRLAAEAPGTTDATPIARDEWPDLSLLEGLGYHASNAWAIGGSRTADGHPLLANDMHLSLRAPATWYLNVLRADEGGLAVAGLSIPGAPGVIVGFNRSLAWAFTNAMVDDADFVVESLDLDGSRYRDTNGWRTFDTREETIVVRGRTEPERFTVRSTRRGPVVTDVLPSGGLTMSLLWTGLEPAGAAAAVLDMNRARSATELERAIAAFRSPHQNVVYATTDGTLGYRMSGSVPIRPGGALALPVSFERLPDGWRGFWPPDSMPAVRGPESDYLASANNLQSWPAFGRVGFAYPLPFRARRIVDRVSGARDWTVSDMRDLQLDTYSLWAERLLPRAVAAARRIGADSLAGALESWDLRAATDARGAAPFYVWLYRLRQLIAADDLAGGPAWLPDVAFVRLLEGEDPSWIDDRRTPEVVEELRDLEESAARTAASVAGRRWGEVHLERSFHPLGEAGWLDRVFRFHVGPYPGPGGRHTVRPDDPGRWSPVDSSSWRTPMVGRYGPSERFVAHLVPGDPRGHFLLPTGQSGNPLDPHYRNMAEVWTEGALIELRLGSEPEAESRLELVPSEGG